jgi:hypothetical protein
MNRQGAISTLVILALAALHIAVAQVAWADTARPRQMVVVVADAEAMRQADNGASLANSFLGLVATLRDSELLTVISVDDPSNVLGPFEARAPDFKSTLDDIAAKIAAPGSAQDQGLTEAIAEAYGVLTRLRAAPGSTAYVVTGRSPQVDFVKAARQLDPLLPRFVDNGWTINGASLPDASRESLEFLESVSSGSGGRVFELSVSDGFRELADSILSQGSKGSLSPVGRLELTPGDVLTSVIKVAPGTRETTLLFFKEDPYGSLRLSNPSGFEASAGDRTASYVVETPHVVVWRLADPAPGTWKIDARGIEGRLSVWEHSSNKYSLVLRSPSPVSITRPDILVAYVQDGEQAVALEGVRLFASITAPNGATMVHEMKDNGTEGDAAAADGYFSLVLPPLDVEGEYQVGLELTWTEYDHRISSQTAFEARAFPAVQVELAQTGHVRPGERTRVASVHIHVQGDPYPVPPDRLAALLGSPEGQQGTVDLQPRRLYGDGPAWEYDVFFTPQEPGLHSLSVRITLEYAGRMYNHTSESIVLSSKLPPPLQPAPALASSAPPAVESTLVAPPTPARSPLPPMPQIEPSGFPVEALVVSILLALGAMAVAVYLLTRGRPHGYLYNDRNKPLVEFSSLRRKPILGLLFRGSVRGRELNVPGLEGLVFDFSRRGIVLRARKGDMNVRVNNQPLTGSTKLQDRTWIGTGGRLYTFMLNPLSAQGG